MRELEDIGDTVLERNEVIGLTDKVRKKPKGEPSCSGVRGTLIA